MNNFRIYDMDNPKSDKLSNTNTRLSQMIDGHIKIIHPKSWPSLFILAEDNEPEHIEVYVVHKRKLHVTTDRMLAAQRDMDTQPSGRLSGLRLSLYPN